MNIYLILINCLTKLHAHLPPSVIRIMFNADQNCFYVQPFEIVLWEYNSRVLATLVFKVLTNDKLNGK